MPLVSRHQIEEIRLDGGRACLDFVNSIHDRHDRMREDYLTTPERYAAWCVRVGLLTTGEAQQIDFGSDADGLMRDIGTFRESLYHVFCSRIDDMEIPTRALRKLDTWLHRAWRELELDVGAPKRLRWLPRALDAQLPLKRLALSALDVLQNDSPERLKRCATEGKCGWLFYDETKNNSRQWCSMQSCGAAAKMRRYRARAPPSQEFCNTIGPKANIATRSTS